MKRRTSEINVQIKKHGELWVWHCPRESHCLAESKDSQGSYWTWLAANENALQHARQYHDSHQLPHDTTIPLQVTALREWNQRH